MSGVEDVAVSPLRDLDPFDECKHEMPEDPMLNGPAPVIFNSGI